MTAIPTWPQTQPLVRPKDRKQRIEAAATQAFARRGYHQVSMSDVATSVGISAPALYRHFANKYDLFKNTAIGIVDSVESSTRASLSTEDGVENTTPALHDLVAATLDSLGSLRGTGDLIRSERRYLEPADLAIVDGHLSTIYGRFATALEARRPDLGISDSEVLSRAAFATLSSVTMHRTSVSPKAAALLHAACVRVFGVDLPASEPEQAKPVTGIESAAKRELIVDRSIGLFFENGYNLVSIEDIGAAVGITASGVYRHFESKAAILSAACNRAAELLGLVTRRVLAEAGTEAEALDALVEAYVKIHFEQHKLMQVYLAEATNLEDEHREWLIAQNRDHIEEWVRLIRAADAELSAPDARCVAHAGFHVVDSLGRVEGWSQHPSAQERVTKVLRTVLDL